MERVTENTVVEVGKYYEVRCAELNDTVKTVFIPVYGSAHKDSCFGFDPKHFHIDGRFVDIKNPVHPTNPDGTTNGVIAVSPKDVVVWNFVRIVYKKLKCKRLKTGICPPTRGFGAEKYYKWYDGYLGKSCAGKKCPHMGTIMQDRGDKLVCPLHHLVGDKTTEKIIQFSR